MTSVRLWLTIIFPYSLGYFISNLYRSINAILAHPLGEDLHLKAVEIGWTTSTYLLTFALVQLPLGRLLDYWGARKIQALFFFIGGVGIIIFGLVSNVALLALGRGILGIGMAGGLMAAFKAVSEWVNKEKMPLYNGIILGAGGIGALAATTPSKLFEIHYGWRSLCIILGILTFLIALLILFVARVVLWRKTSYGTQSEEGSRFLERAVSIWMTLKKQGRQILPFFQQAYQATFHPTITTPSISSSLSEPVY